MTALILNSGIGSRMGKITANNCKCLVEIVDGITLFDIQIKFLLEAGITNFCITTGHQSERLKHYAKLHYPDVAFTFVHNPLYNKTNYIYSIYLAKDMLDDDILLLHGDLLFERSILYDALASSHSIMVVDGCKPLPSKDFKAIISDDKISRVGVDEFGEGACYAQPMYKLLKSDWNVWLNEISRCCTAGLKNVYAENALNQISHKINIKPLNINNRICFEIDNMEDLAYGKIMYPQMVSQQIYDGFDSLIKISEIVKLTQSIKPLVICSSWLYSMVDSLPFDKVIFDAFTPNPTLEEVVAGINLFVAEGCDFIITIGGGSAIDVGKCICILNSNIQDITLMNNVRCKHLSIPTTAGTGSESTCFAVIYKNGVKFSVEHQDILPQYVILDAKFLDSLPMYHKKSALLDALCQAIESIWAKGATNESKHYAKQVIKLIMNNFETYLTGSKEGAKKMIIAANLAGKAINISKTTAAHAMSYKMTSLYGVAHGHAVAICLPLVWKHILHIHNEGNESHLKNSLNDIAVAMGAKSFNNSLEVFQNIYKKMELPSPHSDNKNDLYELTASVNNQRLENHPVKINKDILLNMYSEILYE